LSAYRLEHKLTYNAVQIILANTRMNEVVGLQLNIQISQRSATIHIRGDEVISFALAFSFSKVHLGLKQ